MATKALSSGYNKTQKNMLGAIHVKEGNYSNFRVWAPEKSSMILQIVYPYHSEIEMLKDDMGYFHVAVSNSLPGTQYFYKPDGGTAYPDPASHYQPEGVHGASAVIDHAAYQWQDGQWKGIPFSDLIIYELHIGTFTPQGTF